jgi:hypothetical protein
VASLINSKASLIHLVQVFLSLSHEAQAGPFLVSHFKSSRVQSTVLLTGVAAAHLSLVASAASGVQVEPAAQVTPQASHF